MNSFTIISKFFNENPNFLVDHHLQSYNKFVDHDIGLILSQNNPIQFNKKIVGNEAFHKCNIYIGGRAGNLIKYGLPILHNHENEYMYPNLARLQNLTYSFSILVDIECEFIIDNVPVPETKTIPDIFFGNIPIMLHSNKCILHKMPPEVRFNMGECKIDPGGYFIIDGSEKTIICQETFANNILRVEKEYSDKYYYNAEIRSESEDESKSVRTTSVRMVTIEDTENNPAKDEMKHIKQLTQHQIVVDIPNVTIPMPLFIVFRALGVISDKDIINMCVPDDDPTMMELLRPSVYDAGKIFSQHLAIQYISEFTKGSTVFEIMNILSNFMLPHIGDLQFIEKAHFIGYMVNRVLRLSINLDVPTDRDSFKFKRVEPSGVLLSDLFKEFYKKQIEHIILKLDTHHTEHESTYDDSDVEFKSFFTNHLSGIMQDRITEKGIISGFKGDWGSETYTKRIGLSQQLNRLSYNTAISLLRKCVMQLDESAAVVGPRYLHGTQWGMMDPVDSDGSDVGTHKSFSICTKISTGTSKTIMLDLLNKYESCLEIINSKPSILNKITKIFVNGHWKYSTHDPMLIVTDLKHKRRTGQLDIWTSISFNIRENIIYIYTDAGRVYRPVLYIDEHKLSYVPNDLTWNQMIHGTDKRQSMVEYIDSAESDLALIDMEPRESYVNTTYTHCEIHPSLILGFMGLQIIFPENNQLPRNAFSCGQSRQAVSVYNSNYQNRMDKMGVVLNYGQVPLIKSYYLQYLNKEQLPYGINAMVAIMSYTGYNTEDAIIFNKAALDRGMFNTSYFTVYSEKEDSLTFTENKEFPQYDENGIIREQMQVSGKTPIVHMTGDSKSRFKYTKRDQMGYVDKTFITNDPIGSRTVKIRICEERIPNIGDKFASRAGQKGTCGIVLSELDMPFNANGIRPDLIINPHALPSRMTIGQLLECLIGKVHLEHGSYGDCTAFNAKTNIPKYQSELIKYGFNSTGTEILHNGMTGEQITSNIFMGPTYYMRLKHMVKDKINFRERGPMTGLTRQPVQGRSNEGGLRIGEMERDGVVANGLNMFETESMMTRGDGTYTDPETNSRNLYRIRIDNATGLISIQTPFNHISPTLDGPLDIDTTLQTLPKHNKSSSTLNVPYSFKLLIQELATMNVQMRIVTSDTVDQLKYMGWKAVKSTIESQGYTLMVSELHDFADNSLFVTTDPTKCNFAYMLNDNGPILNNTLFPCIYNLTGKNLMVNSSTSIQPKRSNILYNQDKFKLRIYYKEDPTESTLQRSVDYIFNHLKTGIFVRIKDNKVCNFILMYNKGFRNDFSELLHVEQDGVYKSISDKQVLLAFLKAKGNKHNDNPEDWHATNCLIRTEKEDKDPTDGYLSTIYDMFVNTCNHRTVNDSIFILNRKDFPHLHASWKEPFVDLYGDKNLSDEYAQQQFIPVLSQSTHADYADIPIPTGDDWPLISNKYFATYSKRQVTCRGTDKVESSIPWKDRELKFIWRGQSTGCGINEETNPRLKMLELSKLNPVIDVQITRTPERIKAARIKDKGHEITVLGFIDQTRDKGEVVSMSDQVKCKFIFNVEGNSAAYRFGGLFKYGCCILNIESKYKLWFEPFLTTGDVTKGKDTSQFDCITIKSDLSNFTETVQWCETHLDECEIIANNGSRFFEKYFTTDFIYDYVADVLNGVSSVLTSVQIKPPHIKKPSMPRYKSREFKRISKSNLSNTVIIVPFRDLGDQNRSDQLDKFIEHYDTANILIVEQSKDNRKFNRGALLNAGVLYLQKNFPEVNVVVMHDVDIIMNPEMVDTYYGDYPDNPEAEIVHLGNSVKSDMYETQLGRVIRCTTKAYMDMNGFPNNFYGWGGEDDALVYRIYMNGLTVYRPSEKNVGVELPTKNDVKQASTVEEKKLMELKKEMGKWENRHLDELNWKMNGLNSLQFKTISHEILSPTIRKIKIELTPPLPIDDLLHKVFPNPSDLNLLAYQDAYKTASKQSEWYTLSLEDQAQQIHTLLNAPPLDYIPITSSNYGNVNTVPQRPQRQRRPQNFPAPQVYVNPERPPQSPLSTTPEGEGIVPRIPYVPTSPEGPGPLPPLHTNPVESPYIPSSPPVYSASPPYRISENEPHSPEGILPESGGGITLLNNVAEYASAQDHKIITLKN